MNLTDIREKIHRARFFIDKIKYSRKRHFYFIVPGFIFLIVISFIIVFTYQRLEIKRKDNILKSYYCEDSKNITTPEGSDTLNNGGENIITLDTADSKESDDTEDLCWTEGVITVYICGEVKNPGVYDIENGSRIVDILELAGGQNENACLESINLAEMIADGQRIYIPSQEEIKSSGYILFMNDHSQDQSYPESGMVNINKANNIELESLPGIGPVTAQSIIDYRNKNGLFRTKEELKNVTGIGEKKYEKIERFISI